MRGNKYVGKGQQTRQLVVLQDLIGKIFKENAFLFLVDIQRNAAHVSALQGLDEGPGMNKAPPADVDKHNPGFRQGQGVFVNNVIGLWGQREMQRDEVAFSCERPRFHLLDAILSRPFLIRISIKS